MMNPRKASRATKRCSAADFGGALETASSTRCRTAVAGLDMARILPPISARQGIFAPGGPSATGLPGDEPCLERGETVRIEKQLRDQGRVISKVQDDARST